MRGAVIGHVEWIWFLDVDAVPKAGEIVTARSDRQEPAGGGAVAAVQMRALARDAEFYTALGDDAFGRAALDRLEALGVAVHATFEPAPQRRGVTFVDARGERTIVVSGRRLDPSGAASLPWERLGECGGVYVCAGDAAAIRAARRARVVVATARILPRLREAAVPLDALVGSADDPAEAFGRLEPEPGLYVQTDGARGGSWWRPGEAPRRYEPVAPPGPVVDSYGAGDSFAAALAFGLGEGRPAEDAIALAARCGAAATALHGPFPDSRP